MVNDMIDDDFLYIDSFLPDCTSINNIDFNDDSIVVENSDGNNKVYSYSDKLNVRIFKKIEIDNLQELIYFSKIKKVYVIENGDFEKEAIFNIFPEKPLCERINDNDFDIEIENIEKFCNSCWGFLVGKEKEITFSKLKTILSL